MPNDPMERVKARWPDAKVIQDFANRWHVLVPIGLGGMSLGFSKTSQSAAIAEAANHPTVLDYWKERDAE